MEVDAAQYASISLEMLRNGSYLQVFHRNADYLDKPPMLFWLAVLSFKIFGVSTWAYKLPAVLALIAGIYATFRLGKILYNSKIGVYAALILATTQALFLITNDVRTDGILLAFCVLAIWQYIEYQYNKKIYSLFLSGIFLAAALMSKGPIALIIFLSAIGTNFLVHKNWKGIFDFKWFFYFLFVLMLLLPMCYGLYQQFDLHPEKFVYDLKGPSGIKFFFWTQSFGRITGDIYWANYTSIFTFLHTFLWDFQPWALLAIIAFVYKLSRLKNAVLGNSNEEFLSLGAFLFPFISLSLSKFRLPHYIFPLFPYMSIILAQFISEKFDTLKNKRLLLNFQFGLLHVFYTALIVSYFYFFGINNYPAPIILLIGIVVFYYVFFDKKLTSSTKILMISIITSIAFAFNMSVYFYPQLLEYQSESKLGKEIGRGKIDREKVYCLNTTGHSLDFYGGKIFKNIDTLQVKFLPKGSLVFADEIGKNTLISQQEYIIKRIFEDYPVTQLNINFLKKSTRNKKVKFQYLLEKVK
jgi:4-amino-4-deoxy-L-arabinose transferase-like glycosyltransferase